MSVMVTLSAQWTASLVGHESVSDMTEKLRASLLTDPDEVLTLPGVTVTGVTIVADGVLRSSGGDWGSGAAWPMEAR